MVPLHHPISQLLQLHHLMCLLCTLAQSRNQNHAQSLFMNQSLSRSTNILHLTQSLLMFPFRNLNPTILHLTLRHLPHLSPNLFLKYITLNLNLTLSPLLSTIHPTLNPNPSIINHIPNLLQNLTILLSPNHIIPLSLSIMLHSLSTTHHSLSPTTHPHPSRSHTTLRTSLILTLSQSITIITATMLNPTLHHLHTEHLHQLLNLHQRSQQLLRQLQLQQPQILLLAILLLDNCMQI